MKILQHCLHSLLSLSIIKLLYAHVGSPVKDALGRMSPRLLAVCTWPLGPEMHTGGTKETAEGTVFQHTTASGGRGFTSAKRRLKRQIPRQLGVGFQALYQGFRGLLAGLNSLLV